MLMKKATFYVDKVAQLVSLACGRFVNIRTRTRTQIVVMDLLRFLHFITIIIHQAAYSGNLELLEEIKACGADLTHIAANRCNALCIVTTASTPAHQQVNKQAEQTTIQTLHIQYIKSML
jgi:hypothetical protein